MHLTLFTYGGSSRVLKMQLFGGWSPENAIFSLNDVRWYIVELFFVCTHEKIP